MDKFCSKHVELAKSKYYSGYFYQYKDDSKKQWQMINQLLNRKTKKIKISKLVGENGEVINTPTAIAEKFNDYFSNIASNLKSQISSRNGAPVPPDEFETFLTDPVECTMYVRPVSSSEVYNIIKKFKNKATRDSKVSALKVANCDFKFTQALADIITASFQEGIFPQTLKSARVVPIHKGGAKTDVANYRPISLLSTFSKIYEKLMHHRLTDFMESNGSFYDMQYGFRSGRSCEHALLKAQSILLNSLNKNKISLLLLIDFSKAFDMVEHSILLKKLYHYGIRGTSLKWLESYLENREQYVSVNGKDSSSRPLRFGVPQGSILGPLLFVIYINDIPEINKLAHFILYADDANIIITGDNIAEVKHKAEELGKILLRWVDCNGLALNLRKTTYMIFSKHRNVDLEMKIGNYKIDRKHEARFLGVIVDDKLNWSKHISAVKAKMSRYVGIMYKIKRYLPHRARLQTFQSFVQSHLNFCPLVWGFSAKANIESLFAVQKKAMRAIMPGYVNYFYKDGQLPTHTRSAFVNNEILTVHGVVAKNSVLFMHKIRKFPMSLPQSVRVTISATSPEAHSDHESNEVWLSEYGTAIYTKSVFFKGPLLYNQLLANCNDRLTSPAACISLKYFKNNLKQVLLGQQSLGDGDEWIHRNFILQNINGLRQSRRLNNQLEN